MLASCKDVCEDRAVPRPPTGKTQSHSLRFPPERWYPAHARTLIEGATVTDVVGERLDEYGRMPPSRELTFAEWPEALPWLEGSYPAWRQCAAEIGEVTAGLAGEEYIGVALWRALTHSPADRRQQQALVAGFLVLRAAVVTAGGWQGDFLNSSALFQAVSNVLTRCLPSAVPAAEPAAGGAETG